MSRERSATPLVLVRQPECLMEDSAARFTACDSELQAQCRVGFCWADISVWKRGCDRAPSGLLVCITLLSRSVAVCRMLFSRLSIESFFWLGSNKGRQTNTCMLTETMRGKLRVERRRVLNHKPNTGSYWVVSNGTPLRESRKNIDLLKCEMCLARRRATTAARLLKERQPPISVNKTNKVLTHKGLSARLTAKGWQQKVGVKRRKREKTNNVKMGEHALSEWAWQKTFLKYSV